jgi:predicted nucleotidyltransferase
VALMKSRVNSRVNSMHARQASLCPLSVDEIRKRLAPLLKDSNLLMVLLFGSAASGVTHRESDIDLGFLFQSPVDILALTNDVIRLLHTDAVDVVDLKKASPVLTFAAVRDGILIYEREDGVFNQFYSLAFRRYVDTGKLRESQTEAVGIFLKKRGL